MLNLSNRRYTGAKTKLLSKIDETLLQHFDYTKHENLSFFDVFAGTGVVSEYFIKKKEFKHLIINDFLESNFVIYNGFFTKKDFDKTKLEHYAECFNNLDIKTLQDNYYSLNFGSSFFSMGDSKKIGFIRDELDRFLELKKINQQEFYLLLASLLYSVDRIANTVGHYDAYRKNVDLQDKFDFMLIDPIKSRSQINIHRQDSNDLARDLKNKGIKIDVAFIDPPYNSRQYSRFYHILETLTLNNKPQLYGIAKKPEPTKISEYCKANANKVFKDLLDNLSAYTKYIVMTYNNTNSANARSNARLSLNELKILLETIGTTHIHEYDYKAFNSGKTDTKASFKAHKEHIFVCKVNNKLCHTTYFETTINTPAS